MQACELLADLCNYVSKPKKVKKHGKTVKRGEPDYLKGYVKFVGDSLTEY